MASHEEYTDYEDYSKTADKYDKYRNAFGYEIILGALAKYARDKPLSSLNILEAGCGTGNTTVEMCSYVGHVTAVDGSDDMIRVAGDKLKGVKNVSFKNVDLRDKLPFESDKFDGVLLMQVAHHLDDIGPDGNIQTVNIESLISEFHRVLKKGAPLIIATYNRRQVEKCVWYYHLAVQKGFPEIVDAHKRRYLLMETYTKICQEKGFGNEKIIIPVSETYLNPKHYFNENIIISEEFRLGESGWRDFEKAERFPQLLAAFQEAIDKQEVQEYIKQSEAIRAIEGAITFLVYSKE